MTMTAAATYRATTSLIKDRWHGTQYTPIVSEARGTYLVALGTFQILIGVSVCLCDAFKGDVTYVNALHDRAPLGKTAINRGFKVTYLGACDLYPMTLGCIVGKYLL